MAKKNNSRKVLAVALGIVGVAGLSLASASTLTVNVNDDNIAVGTNTFDAACDDAVTVDYTYDLVNNTYDELLISGIAAGCNGLNLDYNLVTSGADFDSSAVIAGTSVTVDISSLALSADLESIDIAIY